MWTIHQRENFSSDDIPKQQKNNIVTDQGLMNQNTDKKYMNRYQLLDLAGLVQPTWKFRTESTGAVSPPFPLKRPKMAIWVENYHFRKDWIVSLNWFQCIKPSGGTQESKLEIEPSIIIVQWQINAARGEISIFATWEGFVFKCGFLRLNEEQ